MSNVSITEPVESVNHTPVSVNCAEIAGAVIVAATATAAVALWLAKELVTAPDTETNRRERSRNANKARTEVARRSPNMMTSMKLHSRDAESLLRTAASLGYRQEALKDTPPGCVLLTDGHGGRLALEMSDKGSVQLHTVGGESVARKILHQNTAERALEFLKMRNMEVNTKRLRNGELQIKARSHTPTPEGEETPTLSVQVKESGCTVVDVSCTKGSACVDLARDFATAVGSEIAKTAYKPEYQEPGEVRRTKVRA